ncbi:MULTISPECIES: S41 family peptidase [unclassified Streptomyces]|uniref:S41 family peptidase n=1 Tax=unclassified Streptomyces TaxID=2593676 RepID=UPI002254BE43|nr:MULTISPECIES: S41 family peptidase [unclassified Streptomyces]MCX5151612.1 S41 family peptidase [Streptomyces sp. NBC_00320]WSN53977.1 S41 family peptidase [Streptomyces sp. NBC_01296]WSW64693.1 S41 family peptidase [Streptomyces sp. NBC_00998]
MTTVTKLLPAAVIDETAQLLTEHYVFPEIAEQLAGLLQQRLAEGAYDVDGAEELARLVTADLQSVNGDRHLRLKHHTDPVPPKRGAATLEAMRRDFDTSLGGAPRVQLLDGGVAVVELAPMLFPLEWAAEPLGAALTLASRAQALIVDLRANRGGDPDTVAFVCSYLLDERTHLNTMSWRGGERSEQSWSLPHVPGARFGGSKPLYVLTSDTSFSAAEELAYDLQQLGRAVVVGERTRGGAHPCQGWTVHPHLEATIPFGRAINPVSGTNWEGTGVQPNVPCAAADSLDRAHELALARLAS